MKCKQETEFGQGEFINDSPERDWGVGIEALSDLEKTKQLVEEVRETFMASYEDEESYYNPEDVEIVFKSPAGTSYIERYLLRRNLNVTKTVNMIKKALRHFHAEEFTPLKDGQFPAFFYEYGLYYIFGRDMDNNSVLHINLNLYHKLHPAPSDAFQKFLIHLILKAGSIGYERNAGYSVCVDLTGFGLRQVDVPNFVHMTRSSIRYCPWGLKKVFICNLKSWMKPFLKTILLVLPTWIQEMVVIVDKDQLPLYIPKENLPTTLGGHSEENPFEAPADCPDFVEYFWEKYKLKEVESISIAEKYKEIKQNDSNRF